MKERKFETSVVFALLLALLTIIFCLVIADGMLGLNGFKFDHGHGAGTIYPNVRIGNIVFWAFLIGLPVLFSRWVQWRYTILNWLLYFLMYFPVYYAFGLSHNHGLLQTGGFFAFPPWVNALFVGVGFFLIQSAVYVLCNLVGFLARKLRRGAA